MKNLIAIFVCVLVSGCDINATESLEITWKKESAGYYTLNLLDGRTFTIQQLDNKEVGIKEFYLLLHKRGLGGSGSPDIIGTYYFVDEAKEAFRVLYKLEKALVEQ